MTRSGLPAFDNSIVKPDPTLFSIDLSGTQLTPFPYPCASIVTFAAGVPSEIVK
jgi:hypothetical protein